MMIKVRNTPRDWNNYPPFATLDLGRLFLLKYPEPSSTGFESPVGHEPGSHGQMAVSRYIRYVSFLGWYCTVGLLAKLYII
jgi:hypothetical protein